MYVVVDAFLAMHKTALRISLSNEYLYVYVVIMCVCVISSLLV